MSLGGTTMIAWCDIRDRVELQKYIDNNDLDSIVAFVNNACTSCYNDGLDDGYDNGYNDASDDW